MEIKSYKIAEINTYTKKMTIPKMKLIYIYGDKIFEKEI